LAWTWAVVGPRSVSHFWALSLLELIMWAIRVDLQIFPHHVVPFTQK
jgi:hypothetical protein